MINQGFQKDGNRGAQAGLTFAAVNQSPVLPEAPTGPQASLLMTIDNLLGGTFRVDVNTLVSLLAKQTLPPNQATVSVANGCANLTIISPEATSESVLKSDGFVYRSSTDGYEEKIARLVFVSGNVLFVPPDLRAISERRPASSELFDQIATKFENLVSSVFKVGGADASSEGSTVVGVCEVEVEKKKLQVKNYAVIEQSDGHETDFYRLYSDGRLTKLTTTWSVKREDFMGTFFETKAHRSRGEVGCQWEL